MTAQLSIATKSLTVSDSKGYLLDEDGFDYMKYSLLRDIKAQQRSLKWVHAFPFTFVCICLVFDISFSIESSREYLTSYPHAKYIDDAKPWSEQHDVAFPCASQNEIDHSEADAIINSGCHVLIECRSLVL
jgi:glutamate dehydrogenase (NADP+)